MTDWATVVLTAVGGVFVLYQYWRSNHEAGVRAAADELEKFNQDDSVRTALRIVDWHSGYIPYVNEAGVRERRYFGTLDYHLALRPHVKKRSEVDGYILTEDGYAMEASRNRKECNDLFSPLEHYVRDVFDAFLGRLERIDLLIDNGVISKEYFGEFFSYWLHVIGNKKKEDDSEAQFSKVKHDTLVFVYKILSI
ncbi:hypothetical protein RFM99_26375 [Mesorhizobium sp. VK4C]|uniref:hypothetical protein n=1 Tax=Mesorhizobium captivum TaxID=3072319 RepID=UPI002A23B217|nr:hypothetical protein [Mesorhizobium sp. VK4C]MDX8501926.1 hypothetical protein [Mesorhizobium sp. VK4C]